MRFMVYPKKQRMQDSEIIQWARDRMIDDWLMTQPEDAEDVETNVAAADKVVPMPTLAEAVAKLEDDGVATFAK